MEKPYKLASYEFRGAASPVTVGDVKIGRDENVAVICGPCSVESQEQIASIARTVKSLEPMSCAAVPSNHGLHPTAFRVYEKMAPFSG